MKRCEWCDPQLLPVDTSLPYSHQETQAKLLDVQAMHRNFHGKDQWVVPGECKFGPCLNPQCTHGRLVEAHD